jgi:hypothetical protein
MRCVTGREAVANTRVRMKASLRCPVIQLEPHLNARFPEWLEYLDGLAWLAM